MRILHCLPLSFKWKWSGVITFCSDLFIVSCLCRECLEDPDLQWSDELHEPSAHLCHRPWCRRLHSTAEGREELEDGTCSTLTIKANWKCFPPPISLRDTWHSVSNWTKVHVSIFPPNFVVCKDKWQLRLFFYSILFYSILIRRNHQRTTQQFGCKRWHFI